MPVSDGGHFCLWKAIFTAATRRDGQGIDCGSVSFVSNSEAHGRQPKGSDYDPIHLSRNLRTQDYEPKILKPTQVNLSYGSWVSRAAVVFRAGGKFSAFKLAIESAECVFILLFRRMWRKQFNNYYARIYQCDPGGSLHANHQRGECQRTVYAASCFFHGWKRPDFNGQHVL